MEKGTHGINEVSFEELSYADQAKSLNAQISILGKALKAHIRKAQIEGKDFKETKSKYILQLDKIIQGLQ
jgi:hypothetical protein